MSAQIATGHAFMILRELNQLSMTLTEQYTDADAWRVDTKRAIIQLIHETVATLRDERHAAALARNVGYRSSGVVRIDRGGIGGTRVNASEGSEDDPMVLVHALRSHLYHGSNDVCRRLVTVNEEENNKKRGCNGEGKTKVVQELNLFERCKLIDLLHEFTISYRNLLRLASSPLPFVLVQMGRTFVFIWTLSLPFVLVGENFIQVDENVIEEQMSAFSFVILLTYGFLGLEFVSRMLANPFGDEIKSDFNIRGMGSAAVVGIEQDSDHQQRRRQRTKSSADENDTVGKLIQKRQESIQMSTRYVMLDGSKDWDDKDSAIQRDSINNTHNSSYYSHMEEEASSGNEMTSSVFL